MSFQFILVFMIIVFGIFMNFNFSFSNSRKMYLKVALFSSSSLKHIRWRFRTCVSYRVSVKRYAQNKTLRRCASMHNKWYYSSFEILHHLLPSIFVLVFCQGCRTGSRTVVGLTLRIFVCFSSVFRMFFTVATVTAC